MHTANSNINFISLPPKPNVKIAFGDDVNPSLSIRFYTAAPPNKFHRWMVRKLLGIKIELI
jgi:hypothetical protein